MSYNANIRAEVRPMLTRNLGNNVAPFVIHARRVRDAEVLIRLEAVERGWDGRNLWVTNIGTPQRVWLFRAATGRMERVR